MVFVCRVLYKIYIYRRFKNIKFNTKYKNGFAKL